MTRQGFKNYFREWWHFSYPAADGRTEFDFSIGPE
jgi:D-alanyl-D-alanine dipeptidase